MKCPRCGSDLNTAGQCPSGCEHKPKPEVCGYCGRVGDGDPCKSYCKPIVDKAKADAESMFAHFIEIGSIVGSERTNKKKVAEALMEYFQLHGYPEPHIRPSMVAEVMAEFIIDRVKL